MSARRSHIETLMNTIEGLGYALSSDMFDFDAVPSSVMDKSYRWQADMNETIEISGSRVEKRNTVTFWLAHKITVGGDRRTAMLALIDSMEAAEDALLNALNNLPGLVVNSETSKEVDNYVVIMAEFEFTYWRDI